MKKNTVLILGIICLLVFGVVEVRASVVYDDEVYDEIDFDGETITIAGDYIENDFITEDKIKQAEEKFNVVIENHARMDHGFRGLEERMSRLMAGDAVNEIWKASTFEFLEFYADGAIHPVEEVVGEDYYDQVLETYPEYAGILEGVFNEFQVGDGYNYALIPFDPVFRRIHLVYFNKEIIDAEGLENPYELYESGEWTWDEMGRMMREASRDRDGDGSNDQWGLAETEYVQDHLQAMAVSNDTRLTLLNEENQYEYNADSEEFMEAIRTYLEWQEEDLIVEDYDQFAEGNTLFVVKDLGEIYLDEDWPALDEWGILPHPKGPNADKHISYLSQSYAPVVTATSDRVEEIVALWDYLYTPEYLFPEDTVASLVPDKESYDIVMESIEEIRISRHGMFHDPLMELYDELLAGEETSVEEAFKAFRPVAEGRLSDRFDY